MEDLLVSTIQLFFTVFIMLGTIIAVDAFFIWLGRKHGK